MPCKFTQGLHISIHAPSRERRSIFKQPAQDILFQSTLPRGSDLICQHFFEIFFEFQSTLPRGSD